MEETRTFETPGKGEGSTIEWRPIVETPEIMRCCEVLNIEVGDIIPVFVGDLKDKEKDEEKDEEKDMEETAAQQALDMFRKQPVTKLFECLWICVSSQASKLGVKKPEFFRLLPPSVLMKIPVIMMAAGRASFPQMKDLDGVDPEGENENPKDIGD